MTDQGETFQRASVATGDRRRGRAAGVAAVTPPDGRDIVSALVLLHVVAFGIVFWLYRLSPP